ncbi:ABC transporter ATP-binding protein [Lacrimispora sp.]|uniref:ABC transporter ATP-binding protein n=1 Tax=Lacrimispora sp. TaxID=2719234 RepID=UPI0039939B48
MVQLKAEGIKKSFDGRTVLEGVSLNLREGELVSLLGASGGGKTTLFQILAGLSLPDEGHVYINEEEVTGKPGKISYMLQKDLLLPYRTVEDNVALPLLLSGMKKAEARKKASGYFEMFGLEGTEKKYPSQLSGGMRQRAALLRTYLFSRPIALLDEPFSAIDMLTRHTMHEWYLKVMEEIRLSTLFITHDIDEAVLLSDRICILTGTPGNITKEIIIKEAKPRNKDFHVSEEFLEYKREIIRHMEQS